MKAIAVLHLHSVILLLISLYSKDLFPKILGQDFWFWNEPQLSYDYGMSDLIYDNEITDNGSSLLEKDTRYLNINVFEDKLVKKLK